MNNKTLQVPTSSGKTVAIVTTPSDNSDTKHLEQLLEDQTVVFGNETNTLAELNTELKERQAACQYPLISLDFLQYHIFHKGVTVPQFATHLLRTAVQPMVFQPFAFNIRQPFPQGASWYDFNTHRYLGHYRNSEGDSESYDITKLPPCINKAYLEGFQTPQTNPDYRRNNLNLSKQGLKVISRFEGIIPVETKQKITTALAEKQFDQIVLISGEPKYDMQQRTKDPLIVGIVNDEAFLIDHFDMTEVEQFIKDKFTT